MGFFVSPLDALFRVSDFLGGGVASTPTLDSQDDGSLFQVSSLNGLQCPFFGSFDIITFQSVLGEGWWFKSRSFSEFHIHSSQPLTTFFLCAFKEVFFGCSSFSTGNSSHFPWDFCFVGSHAQPVFFYKELDLENFWGKYWSQPLDPNMFFFWPWFFWVHGC